MKFVVSIDQDEDGMYIAECPSIPGCVSQGQTEAEAEANIADAIRECLAVRAKFGIPLTVATREVELAVIGSSQIAGQIPAARISASM
jgi:predicted RNase H-like HicB family nuclease